MWQNGEYLAADQVEFEGRIYVPPQQPGGLASAMRFPAGLGENLTARELLAEMERALVRFIDVAEDSRFLPPNCIPQG